MSDKEILLIFNTIYNCVSWYLGNGYVMVMYIIAVCIYYGYRCVIMSFLWFHACYGCLHVCYACVYVMVVVCMFNCVFLCYICKCTMQVCTLNCMGFES